MLHQVLPGPQAWRSMQQLPLPMQRQNLRALKRRSQHLLIHLLPGQLFSQLLQMRALLLQLSLKRASSLENFLPVLLLPACQPGILLPEILPRLLRNKQAAVRALAIAPTAMIGRAMTRSCSVTAAGTMSS